MKTAWSEVFGVSSDGDTIRRYVLENEGGMRLAVLDYGGRIQSLLVPDSKGMLRDVVLGFDSLKPYENGGCYGALIGRHANRIKNGRFQLNGKTVQLEQNDHGNFNHGNLEHKRFSTELRNDRIIFRCESPDGEQGFPGELKLTAEYILTEENEISFCYRAESSKDTVINITNHSYFNLDGFPPDKKLPDPEDCNIFSHRLTIPAEAYLEADEVCMATGKVCPVEGTVFDFRTARPLGEYPYDNNYCFGADGKMKLAARLEGENSGIVMECLTTQPGMQLFTGSKLAAALETQHYPDSPNHPEWPSAVLRAGQIYSQETVYRFGCKGDGD